ncbi:MAG TPA: DUF4214 domain-containing protein [Pirellulales bacterium]|nr:DUF4214 domain-containing protein [Pirellulales bacterium]
MFRSSVFASFANNSLSKKIKRAKAAGKKIVSLRPLQFEPLEVRSLLDAGGFAPTFGSGDTLTPAGIAATFTATQGAALSTTLASFTDSDTGSTAGDFTATIDWGDGSTGMGVVSSASPGTLTVSGSHVYAAEGARQATVTLADDAPGTATATASATVNVSAAPAGAPNLTITKTGPASANVGDLVTYSVTIANSGGTATNVQFDDAYSASNLTIFSVWDTGGNLFSVSDGVVSGTIGNILHGSSDTITLVAIPTRRGAATDPIAVAVPEGNAGMVTTTPNSTTINAAPASAANVSINETAPVTAVAVGDKLTTTVTLKNNAATPVTNLAFLDSSPGQAFFSASDTNGTAFTFNMNTGDMIGTVASIAGGASDTITIVTVPTSVNATADAATIGIAGGNQPPNTASATATLSVPASAPDITVTKSGPATVLIDTPVTDTIQLTNSTNSSTPASVSFVDDVGSTVTYVTASDGQPGDAFTYNPMTGMITGTVSAAAFVGAVGGKGGTATVTVTLTTEETGSLTDIASVAVPGGNTAGPALSDSLTTTVTAPAKANLAIANNGSFRVFVGGTETYTILISNSGATPAAGAILTDVVPAGLTNVQATDPEGTVTIKGNTVTDILGAVSAETTNETLTITATVTAAALPSGTQYTPIYDTASVTFNGTTSTDTTITTISAGPLSIAKIGSPPTVAVGGTETYTLTITNPGDTAATGAILFDTVPAGFNNVQATDSAGLVAITGNTVSDALGTLAANTGSETLTITATAAPLPGGTTSTSVTNTASVAFAGLATTSNAVTTTINAPTTIRTGQPGDGTPQTFVDNLYRELLGREPDSAGDAFWVAYLAAHDTAAGQAQVIQAFMSSPEHAIEYLTTVYQVFLGRVPDAGGLQFWTQAMSRPGTPGQPSGSADEKYVLAAILGSQEFYRDSGSTLQGWINALYEDLLGRAPDGNGLRFWTNALTTLGSSSRGSIVLDLLTTPEAAHKLLDSFYPAAGGTSGNPLPAPGSLGSGPTDLAIVTGGGWENLYLEGPYGSAQEANDGFFAALAGGAGWDDVQLLLLEAGQFYNNPNRPIT